MELPIDAILPELVRALRAQGRAVLQAPPGAGKTTRVPLALLPEVAGKIVMLEPRRLAARAAAERMAETLGEKVGATVGYRVRGDAAVGPETRIEVVTEGILTRMVQENPELPGIGAVIFDEFHERSLNADLGLALTWEVRGALREDLWLVVMSATLDAGPVAALLDDAPMVSSEGRAFPVETRWLEAPPRKEMRFEAAVSEVVLRALDEAEGGCLVFLPGEGEIRRVASALEGRVPGDVVLRPLFGAMKLAEQRAAVRPEAKGRKVVLATSIAETSLTIEDVRIVVDGARLPARRDRGGGFDRAGVGIGALGRGGGLGISDAAARGRDDRGAGVAAVPRRAGCRRCDHDTRQGTGADAPTPEARAYAGARWSGVSTACGASGGARPVARPGCGYETAPEGNG